MKRQIFMILLITLSFSIIHAELSEQGFIMSDIDQIGLEPFDFVVNSTELTTADQAISFQFDLNYDASLFTYNGYTGGSEIPGMLVINDLNPGMVMVAYAGSSALEGSLELITINLTPIGGCNTQVTLTDARYNNTDVTNFQGGSIIVTPIPEVEFVVNDVEHQGLTEFSVSIESSEILEIDNIISYQFCFHYDSALWNYVDYTLGANLSGQVAVNPVEAGLLNVAYSGSEPIIGINELISFNFLPIAYGNDLMYLSQMAMNNFILEEEVNANVTVYPAWDEMLVEVTGADVYIGDTFTSNINTSLIMEENNILSFQFIYTYDPELLEYVGIANNDRIGEFVINSSEPGVIQCAYASSDPIIGAGMVIGFDFNALDEGNTELALAEFVYNNEYIATTPGQVTITNPNSPADAEITMDSVITVPGEIAEINLYSTPLEAGFEVISYQYSLTYDPEILSYVDYTAGEGMPEGVLVVNGTQPGVVNVAFSSADPIIEPVVLNGLIFAGAGTGESDLVLSDFYYNNIEVTNLYPGSISVYEPYYFTDVYVEDFDADLDIEFTCNVMTEELLAEWNIISYQFHMYYDPEMLEFTGYQVGDLPAGGSLLAYELEPGHLSVAFADYTPIVGAGSLAGFNFIPLQLGQTTVEMEEFKYNALYLPETGDGTIEINIPYEDAVISAPDVTIPGDQNFVVGISTSAIEEAYGVISFQFDLGFDPELIEYVGFTAGPDLIGGNLLAFENESGNLSVAYANFAPISVDGDLIELEFHSTVQTGQTALDIENFKYNTLYLEDINDGSVTVIEPYSDAVITCSDIEVRQGNNFTISVSSTEIVETWQVISFQFNLGFDPTLVDFVGYSTGEMTSTSGSLLAYENQTGNVSIAFADYMPLGGIGELIELEFAATNPGDFNFDVNGFKYNALYLPEENQIDGYAFIHPGNYIPIADAGEDQGVMEGEIAQLNGSGSYDPDDNIPFRGVPEWDINPPDFEYSGFIWGVVEVNGIPTDDVNDVLGVFVGDECRGVAQQSDNSVQYIDFFGQTFFMPMVYSNVTAGETLVFKYYDASTDEIHVVNETMEFTADMVVGDGNSPYVFDVTVESGTPSWSVNAPDYEYSGFIWGVVQVNGINVDDVNDLLGVFVDGECRGVAQQSDNSVQYMDYFDETFFMPQVYSNVTAGETLNFKYYDASEDVIYDIDETMDFTADMVVGDGFNPYVFAVEYVPQSNLIFNWIAPAGIELDDPSLITPQFTAPWVTMDTDYVFGLEVSDGEAWSLIDEVVVTVMDHPLSDVVVSAPEMGVVENETAYAAITTSNVQADMFAFSYHFCLNYDESLMTYSGFTPGELSTGTLIVNLVNPGFLNIAYSSTQYIVGEGELITFNFDTYEGGVSPLDICNFTYNNTEVVMEDGFIAIENINEPPVFTLPASFNYNEDEELVVDFSEFIEDPDNSTHLITAVGNVNTTFDIDGYMVTMSAQENWNGTEMVGFSVNDLTNRTEVFGMTTITVNPVNDPPELDVPPVMYFDEDSFMVFDVGMYAIDVDGDELVLYVENAEELIVEQEGLVATISAPLDWNGEETLSFTIDDQQSRATATDLCSFIVEPMNDAPVLTLPEYISFNEDESLLFDLSEYAYDMDMDELNIVNVEYDTSDLFADFMGMEIDFTATENWFGITDVTITITDNAGRETATDMMTVEVLPVNDAPILSFPEEMIFVEDGSTEFDAAEYIYDVDSENLVMTVSTPIDLIVDIEDFMVTVSAPVNWFGEESLTFTVTDNESRSESFDDCNFVVTPVDDAPVLELPEIFSFNEDETGILNIMDYTIDYDNDPISIVEVLYEETAIDYEINGLDIAFNALENWYGDTELTITISDNTGRTMVSDITMLSVLPVNDAPEIDLPDSFTFMEDAGLTEDFSSYVSDIDGDELVLTVGESENVFASITDLQVVFSTTDAWFGEETLTFSVNDQQGREIASDDVLIIVEPVNDPPVIVSYTPAENYITLNEATNIDFMLEYFDPEGGEEIAWYVNGDLLPGMVLPEFSVTFDQNGFYTVTVEVSDQEFTVENTWEIDVWFGPNWEPVEYTAITTAYTRVSIDGQAASELDLVGAFVGDEMRGWAYPEIDEETGLSYATIDVYGLQVEEIDFVIYDYSENDYYELYETFTSNPGGEIGTPPNYVVLNFGSGEGPNWTPAIYTNSTILYAIVTIEALPAEDGDRVAAFVGSECRAVANVVIDDRTTAYATLIIQGDVEEVAHFKIWDSSADMIYNVPTTIVTDPGYQIGYPPNEVLLNGTNSSDVEQVIDLNSGWNLMSINVYPVSYNVEDIFAELVDAQQLVKVKSIFASYDPNLPSAYNTLRSLEDGGGYYVNVTENTSLSVTGPAVNVDNTHIELNAGWNLTGYLPQYPQPVTSALTLVLSQLIKVKDSYTSYDPTLPAAFNTLDEMVPGNGYWIRMFSAATLIYPEGNAGRAIVTEEQCPVWEPVVYTNSSITYGRGYLFNEPANGFIAAFAGDECRGVSAIENGYISLVVNGEEAEEITFKLYSNGVVYDAERSSLTTPGEDVSGMELFFGNNDAPKATELTGIYPNPFNPETTIGYALSSDSNVRINIYNVRGQLVETLVNESQPAGTYNVVWKADNNASGIYFMRFSASGKTETQKLILMK